MVFTPFLPKAVVREAFAKSEFLQRRPPSHFQRRQTQMSTVSAEWAEKTVLLLLDAVLNSLWPAACTEQLQHCAWFVCCGVPRAAVRPACLMLHNRRRVQVKAHMVFVLVLYVCFIKLSVWPENCKICSPVLSNKCFFFPLTPPWKNKLKTDAADVFEAPKLTASWATINIETSLSPLYIYISLELEMDLKLAERRQGFWKVNLAGGGLAWVFFISLFFFLLCWD